MPTWMIAVIIFLILCLFIWIQGLRLQRQKREELIRQIETEYGQQPIIKRDNTVAEAAWKEFWQEQELGSGEKHTYVVDDLTWQDLDMDQVFQRLNYTRSSAGAEKLYRMLRCPNLEGSLLQEREEMVSFFMQHQTLSQKIALVMSDIGSTGNYQLGQVLTCNTPAKMISTGLHILMDLLYIPAIALLFVKPGPGVLLLFAVLCLNIVTYFNQKSAMGAYLVTFSYVLRMIDCAGKLLDIKEWKECGDHYVRLQQAVKALGPFRKGASIVMHANQATGSAGPLDMILDYIKILFHPDLMKMNQMVKQMEEQKDTILEMADVTGLLDACISICYYRASLDDYTLPVFEEQMQVTDAVHPLLVKPVANSLKDAKCVLVTGSNASGKSTFLKTIAINAILAQTLHMALAKSFCMPRCRVISSMSVSDSITAGDSYYMAEIKALKRILDLSASGEKILCFVDEVLRGTNTVERIAASSKILESLHQNHIICFAATHDIELTYLLESLYTNYHFEEEIQAGAISFSYLLQDGRANSRNAIKLLESIGYDKDVVEDAEKRAKEFLETGNWR